MIKGKRIFSVLFYLLPFTLVPLTFPSKFLVPARAEVARLGVVRNQENAKQWLGISTRLESVGVNYCVLDFNKFKQGSELKGVSVLFLPNVETLNGAQVTALTDWMNRGGKVIVAGPIGSLSQPQVRSDLQSLLGAYWGFTLSSPSTLKPLQVKRQEWVRQPGLSTTLIGGVIIPSGLESQTAAVWVADGTPPAVVVTNNSTFLGWRWGVDAVASAAVDIKWLQASLNRYGKFTSANTSPPTSCLAENPNNNETVPFLPLWEEEPPEDNQLTPSGIRPQQRPNTPTPLSRRPIKPNRNVSFPQPSENYRNEPVISPVEVAAMGQELESLIDRFASALLAADSYHSQINLSTSEAIEQFLNSEKEKSTNSQVDSSNPTISRANQIVIEAREGLDKFFRLIEQKEYGRARQQWSSTRELLWKNYPSDRQFRQPEIRAVWLDRGTIVRTRSEQNLAQLFDQFAATGINTVFFETVNASYPIYPSKVAPEQNPLVQGWDPLEVAVKLAHERGIELHAWVWIFAAANQRHNYILNQPTDYLGPVLSVRPDWGMTNQQGHLFHRQSRKAFFDPANPEVQNYLLSLLEEIATVYQVDGIHFDYIRYPFQSPRANQIYGYSGVSRRQFFEQTGVDPINITPSDRLWTDWTKFRIEQVDNFVTLASQKLKKKRPEIILSAAVFPIQRQERLNKLQQNWEEWTHQGDIDLIVPMTYARDTEHLQKISQPLFSQSLPKATLLLPGIRLLNLPDVIALDQVQFLRDLPTEGYALFAAENFNSNIQKILSRTHGELDLSKKEPLPHRQPFQAALVRYHALQREWSFLLANNQLSMTEAAMQDWGQQADNLSITLQRLANQPSNRNLLLAQVSLASFQGKFRQWMEQHKEVQPYQVQVWLNRLTAVENLLSYGDRAVLKGE